MVQKKKRSLMEKLNPFDKESKERRKVKSKKRKATKMYAPMKKVQAANAAKKAGEKNKVVKSKSIKKSKSMSASSLIKATKVDLARKKKIGASKATAVRKGAKSVVKTKGGEFVKYKKDSKAAGSFRSAFKSSCSGGAKSFSWDGRSYSCTKASSPKKTAKPTVKAKSSVKKPMKKNPGSYSKQDMD